MQNTQDDINQSLLINFCFGQAGQVKQKLPLSDWKPLCWLTVQSSGARMLLKIVYLDRMPILINGIVGLCVILCVILLKILIKSVIQTSECGFTCWFWMPWWWHTQKHKYEFSFATFATGKFLCYCNTLIRVPFHLVESRIMKLFIGLLVLKSSSWHEK